MQVNENAYFDKALQARTLIPSAECVSDAHVATNAGIKATKLEHRYRQVFQQDALAAGTFCLHVCQSAVGLVKTFHLGVRTIGIAGAGTVATLDVKLNGTSVAPGAVPINLMSLAAARIVEEAVLSTLALVEDDWIDIVIALTAGAGTLPTGLYACLEVDELPN